MVKAFEDAGAKIKYTEYPGIEHGSRDTAYSDPKAFKFMFLSVRGGGKEGRAPLGKKLEKTGRLDLSKLNPSEKEALEKAESYAKDLLMREKGIKH